MLISEQTSVVTQVAEKSPLGYYQRNKLFYLSSSLFLSKTKNVVALKIILNRNLLARIRLSDFCFFPEIRARKQLGGVRA